MKQKRKQKRPEVPNYSLKCLRAILGKRGKEFAAEIGMPYRTLVAIEVGQRELQEATARKLMMLYGVLPQTVLEKYFEPPLDLNGEPYKLEFFDAYRARVLKKPEKMELEMAEKAHDHKLRALLETAKRKGVLLPMLFDFQEWLDATIAAYADAYGSDFKRLFDDLNWKDDGAPNVLDRYPLFDLRHGRTLMRYGRTVCASGTGTKKLSPALQKVRDAFKTRLSAIRPPSPLRASGHRRSKLQ